MKKKLFAGLIVLVLTFAAAVVDAGVYQDDTLKGEFTDLNFRGATVSGQGYKTVSIPMKQIPLTDFILNDGTNIAVLSASTKPGVELDNANTAIVWSDGEATAVEAKFRVPSDYIEGGKFRVFVDESSDGATTNQVDFAVYVNGTAEAWDSATTNQTPVALAGTPGTPTVVTLTPATDFSALAAGDIVTVRLWRDDTAVGTRDLELYYAEFYYDNYDA